MNKEIIYIFLDIDGVLNNKNYILLCHYKHKQVMNMRNVPFDPQCLEYLRILNEIISKYYECRIILSSSWRMSEMDTAIVKARLAEYGLKIKGRTPYIDMKRGLEITEFLKDKAYKNIIILDDDDFDIKRDFPNNIVKTNFDYGLTFREIEKSLEILNLEKEF